MRRQKPERKTYVKRLRAEQLESRTLLIANAFSSVAFQDNAHYRANLIEGVDFSRNPDIDLDLMMALANGVGKFTPALVAGSATSSTNPPYAADSPEMRVDPNTDASPYAGVVSLLINYDSPPGAFLCSGSAIGDGSYVLTASHCFDQDNDGLPDPGIDFVRTFVNRDSVTEHDNNEVGAATGIYLHPDFLGFSVDLDNDIAVIKLATPVPAGTPTYSIHSPALPADPVLELVGYGTTGDGDNGYTLGSASLDKKRVGKNVVDITYTSSPRFLSRFDEPDSAETLGNLVETMVGGGDSGGPSFVTVGSSLEIAAVNTFTLDLPPITAPPGEFGGYWGGNFTAQYKPWVDDVFVGADLELTMTESADPVIAGSGAGNIVYTFTVKNLGPNPASAVQVIDNGTGVGLPTGMALHNSSTTQGTFNITNGTWTVGAMAVGDEQTLTVELTAPSSIADGSTIGIASTVLNAEPDFNPNNDSVAEETIVQRNIDIDIDVDDTLAVVAGSGANNITQVITATNNGPSDATGVVITEALTLPTGVSVSSSTPSKGAYNAGTGWTLDLASGESATLTFVLTAAASTADGAAVTVGGTRTASNETDTVAGNDNDSGNTVVNRNIDIDIDVDDTLAVVAGSGANNITQVITATNNGPSDATGVVITEALTLPTGVSVSSSTPSKGVFDRHGLDA